jgi:hypothetical protein
MSALPTSVEALKNERTGKLFIVLDWDVGDKKVKVINPTGDVLDVIKLIFKMDEPVTVSASNFHSSLSEAQLAKLASWEQDQFAEAEKKRLEKAARTSQSSKKSSAAKTGTKTPRARAGSARKEGLIDRKANASSRRPAAQWEASQLTFFRHRIESLKPNDVFSIVLEGQGTFQITKADFQRVFNNVVMNAEYRNQGVFKYDEIPEAARIFIQS